MAFAPALPPLDVNRAPEGGEVGQIQSGWRLAIREFASNRLAVAGVGILVFFVLFSFVGPFFYHGQFLSSDLSSTNLSPGTGHPLGTDSEGFDVLGELMKGGQASLEVGLLSAIFATLLGAVYGAVSGLAGGIVDSLLMRIVDILLSIPFLFIVLIVAVRYGATVLSLSLMIGFFSWQVPSRLVRGEVLTLRVRDFISAAKTAGSSQWRLIRKHLLPNAFGVIVVTMTFQVANSILAVAALGFLGFGLHYPTVDWGDMLSNGITYMQDGYWWLIYPAGMCIVLVVIACNLVGDAMRDSLDVRLRRR
ncbi:MAG TPA: ABC transporter permease [Streptosporangiaceae bacterium]|jgi:ABC-type dipeptide/oligopeptide/nickel transport system permease subunit|nr:ABC transporter permease [Streptosporangiaceae bacterium]